MLLHVNRCNSCKNAYVMSIRVICVKEKPEISNVMSVGVYHAKEKHDKSLNVMSISIIHKKKKSNMCQQL